MVGGDLVGLLVVCGDCWGNTNCLFYFFLTNAFCRVLATMQKLEILIFFFYFSLACDCLNVNFRTIPAMNGKTFWFNMNVATGAKGVFYLTRYPISLSWMNAPEWANTKPEGTWIHDTVS